MSNQTSHQETEAPVQWPDTTFPLMKLPLELRARVYRELLLSENSLRMVESADINGLHPAILRTCRQVYKEATKVLYEENEFRIRRVDRSNPNVSRLRRVMANIARKPISDWLRDVRILTLFLCEHPNLTHLCLDIGGRAIEKDDIQVHIENALQRHNGLTDLEVRVQHPLSEDIIDFCWRLYAVLRRNRGTAARPEEEELHDKKACPPFVKVLNPLKRKLL
jgi:hypothetical protein